MRVRLLGVVLLALAFPLEASYPARDLFIPIAGRGVGGDGRTFYSALWVSNLTSKQNRVAVEFLAAGQPNPSPRRIEFVLQRGETRVFDPVGSEIMGSDAAVGALHVVADRSITASCRTFSRFTNETEAHAVGARFSAIPAVFAIGNGQWTLLTGVSIVEPPQSIYRLYVVETAGQALSYSIELLDLGGHTIAQKPFFVQAHEQRSIDVGAEFPAVRVGHALARVRGLSGNGRIIVAGGQTLLGSRDTVPYEMSFTAEPVTRVPMAETVTYIAVAVAVMVAAWFYRRGTTR